jgi:hypothetical protein
MFFRKTARATAPRVARRLRLPHARPVLEALESRVVPYAVSGNAWPSPQLVTISFVPDGTVMAIGNDGNISSNLFSAFNRIPGVTSPNQWENVILKAAQQWAQQTNVNLSVVADDGESIGAGPYQQGNPNFGDIRIGGFEFGGGYPVLASTFYPPPVNNYSVAGDVAFNTGYDFNIGSTYDLFTVAMHESGHALGMAHSSSSSAVMFPYYNGAFTGLSGDDIAGIRSIYSGGNPRSHDAYNSGGHSNGSFTTAANITSTIDPGSLTSVVTGLDITTANQVEYFKFTAPSNSAGTMNVTVQSTGLSMLTPKVTVYNANHVAIGSATFRLAPGAVQDGATLSVNVSGVVPGATYYVAVGGVDRTAFSTGAYALTLNLGTGANPTVPLPNTQLANGDPLQSGGGVPQTPGPTDTPASDTGPALAAVAHSADANLVNGLVSHDAAAAVVAPALAAQFAVPLTTCQATPAVALPAQSQAAGVVVARADAITEDGAEQLAAPAQKEDADPAPMPQAVPDDASAAVVQPALNDPWLGIRSDLPVEQLASAPAVAEAAASDWTPDGALAAASVVFGGAWLRWHAAHQQDERRLYQRAVNEKQDAP